MSAHVSAEQQRVLDDMLKRRVEGARKTDADEVEAISALVAKGIVDSTRLREMKSPGEIEAEVLQQILALVSGVPDDTPMIVSDSDGPRIEARTMRVWASFHSTPEQTQ